MYHIDPLVNHNTQELARHDIFSKQPMSLIAIFIGTSGIQNPQIWRILDLNIMTSVAKHQMIDLLSGLLIMVPLPGSGSSITGSTSHGMLLPRIVLPKDMFLHTQILSEPRGRGLPFPVLLGILLACEYQQPQRQNDLYANFSNQSMWTTAKIKHWPI